uniref:Uncharacterized protein n=1 Tax=Arundo donax TaxID=35708 RepID=A0A0A9ASM7_ARUDO
MPDPRCIRYSCCFLIYCANSSPDMF